MWLDNCLKSAVPEDASTSNMVNELKHYWNLNDRTFTLFIDHCEVINEAKVSLKDIKNLKSAC